MIRAYSAQLIGLTSQIVTVEVDISNGLHTFSIIGLGDRAVEEAKDRISAAIKNSGYISPKQKNQKVVISLAPANIRKEGPSFDLAMALAYLAACGDIIYRGEKTLLLGELSLDGNIRKVRGVLPIVSQAATQGFDTVFVPRDNVAEACIAEKISVFGISSLKEIIDHLSGQRILSPSVPEKIITPEYEPHDISSIRGNEIAKRGLEIAAAGGHNIIFFGPPGTGKTMLARSIKSILPNLTYEQSIEATSIHSAASMNLSGLISRPPFRSPHHTASYASIVGGGAVPRPGEITLSHRGVLFMDELPEFDRNVIESLRQPLEDGEITISRAQGNVRFPARCMLVATMNPCPCGLGRNSGCTCTERVRLAYRNKISQAIADRIDLWVPVTKIDYEKLASTHSDGETANIVRARIERARERQAKRIKNYSLLAITNGEMTAKDIEISVHMTEDARRTLKISAESLHLSGRAFHRVIKVAQTIADLGGSDHVEKSHVLEALRYRESID